jgi:hypothetical protein
VRRIIEGAVVAVAADGGHRFSKPVQDRKGTASTATPTPASMYGTDILRGTTLDSPIYVKSTSFQPSSSRLSVRRVTT